MKNSLFIILTIAVLSACQSPKEKSLKAIKTLEAADSIFSPKAIEELKGAYLDFSARYPNDELSPEFLFKAAQRCNAVAQHEEALKLFQQIIEKYPANKLCEEALFLQGYVYENSLHNEAKAREVYTSFLDKYPKSELAEDAKLAIRNLGKSPEEIVNSFTNKSDSVN
jgi:TolA-binding protein